MLHYLKRTHGASPEQDDAINICRQVHSMFTYEGIILALIGSILVITAGIYFDYLGSMTM